MPTYVVILSQMFKKMITSKKKKAVLTYDMDHVLCGHANNITHP